MVPAVAAGIGAGSGTTGGGGRHAPILRPGAALRLSAAARRGRAGGTPAHRRAPAEALRWAGEPPDEGSPGSPLVRGLGVRLVSRSGGRHLVRRAAGRAVGR
ncbi:hypothetical protein DDQ41_22875 [Streptomyces spongiicola]|uniref:Uncharacterized protein n=1 Tax=Streptomyces spongiicola TaxID=1690221 RepID=A0ABN5KM58_9ACTN|nr:hypothetical protein DDQ41_22875 [Streptomyces spongiicola]